MIIGVLGDTHGRLEAMASAMKTLADAKAEFYIHTGDVGDDSVLDYLAGLKSAFVFGNNDWDRTGMARYAADIGVQCYGNFADLTLDEKRIAVIHGDDFKLKQRLLAEQEFDLLFQGHTHVRKEERVGKTLVINPGALHRTPQKSVATVDTTIGKVQFLLIK
jgi:putative phosphoesterase